MNIIELAGVHKRYRIDTTGHGRRVRHLLERIPRHEVWALQGVDLAVGSGESVGLIGGNGSGKSTLLRVIAAITRPTSGTVEVHGAISGLLSLGAGLQPLLSGEENALTAAIMAGLSRREALARVPEIAAFAELEDQLDRPLRTYSSGMKLRLAFSVAIHTNPEVLLVDEVLAVGDMRFQAKCLDQLRALNEDGVTVLIASHAMGPLARLCPRTVWLKEGKVRFAGETEEVVDRYRKAMMEALPPAEQRAADGSRRVGRREVEIKDVRLLDDAGVVSTTLRAGVPATVEIDFLSHEELDDAIVSISVHAENGLRCLDLSTRSDGRDFGRLPREGTVRLELERLDLAGGRYHLDVGFYEGSWDRPYDYLWKALPFEVAAKKTAGILAPPRQWTMS